MVVSLVMAGQYEIKVNDSGKFSIIDGLSKETKKLNIKEIPFVRYRFETYSWGTVEYIEKMMEKFSHSAHLLEVTYTDVEETDSLLDFVGSHLEGTAKFLYFDIGNNEVGENGWRELLEAMGKLHLEDVDRIMLRDKTTQNSPFELKQDKARAMIADVAKVTGFEDDAIGICGGGLAFGGRQCLTAERARGLAANYCDPEKEIVTPSANHENMDCCGCIKYFVVDSDERSISEGEAKIKAQKKEREKAEKKAKAKKKAGIPLW